MFLKLAKELSEVKLASKEVDVEWFSKIASNRFINDGKPLNETIAKLAESNGLNEEFIKRICETANHEVSSHMFNTNENKNFQFELADWEKIVPQDSYKFAEQSPYSKSPTDHKWNHHGLRAAKLDGLVDIADKVGYLFQKEATSNIDPYPQGYDISGDPDFHKYYTKATNHPSVQTALQQSGGKWNGAVMDQHDLALQSLLQARHGGAGTPDILKMAGIQLKSDPYESVLDLQESLKRAYEDVDTKYDSNEREQKLAYRKLYNEFKDEVRQEGYFKIAQALVPFVKQETLEELTYELLDDNVINESDLFRIEKTAEIANESALILKIASYYDSLKDEHSVLSATKKEIFHEIERVSDFLRNK